jgi:PAS domain S-box-containing protein
MTALTSLRDQKVFQGEQSGLPKCLFIVAVVIFCSLPLLTFAQVQSAVAEPFENENSVLAFSNSRDWPEFGNIINKVLANTPQAEDTAIQREYLTSEYYLGLPVAASTKWAIAVLVIITGLFTLFVTWIRSLKRQAQEQANKLQNEIHQHEIATRALAESEAQYRGLVENADVGVFHVTIAGEFMYVNESMARMFDFASPEHMTSSSPVLLWKDSAQREQWLYSLTNLGSLSNFEAETTTNTNRTRHSLFSATLHEGAIIGMVMDITERKLAVEQLQLHSEIISNMTEAVYLIRAEDGIIVYTNPVFEKMFGYDPEELVGRHVSIVNAPTELAPEETVRILSEIITKTGKWEGEIENIRKDGTVFWCYARVTVFEHPEYGTVWITAHSDITERKQAQADKEKLYHDIGERLKELNCMYTISKSIQTSESLDEIFRDTVAAIPPGWHYPEITRGKLCYNEKEWRSEPFEETRWKQSSDIVVTGKKSGYIEVYYLQECPILDEGPFMQEERNLIDGIAATLGETIERRLAEEQLRRSEEKFRTLIMNIPGVTWTSDREGTTAYISPNIERTYGYSQEQVYESGEELWFQRIHPEDIERVQRDYDLLFDTPSTPYDVEYRIRNSSGEWIWLHDRSIATYELDDKIYADGIFHDITEYKKSQRKLNKYQQRLKSLALKLTLAEEHERRHIAEGLHDNVGQTLALTRLQLATARQRLPLDNPLDTQFDEISKTLLQAIQETRSLIFELSSPALHELGLGKAIEELLEEQLEIKQGLHSECVDHAHHLQLDYNLRAIMFRNVRELLTNVVKHAQATSVSVKLEVTDGYLNITVQDDGIGFDPITSLRGVNEAKGFGLFSVQERLTDLGGQLTIESQPGAGCMTVMQLPIEAQDVNRSN